MTSAVVFRRVAGACVFTGTWRRSQKPKWCVEARATVVDHQILRPSRSVDEEAVMAVHVHEHDLEVWNLRRRVLDFPELTVAHG